MMSLFASPRLTDTLIDRRLEVVVVLDAQHADVAHRRLEPVEFRGELLGDHHATHRVDDVGPEIDRPLLAFEAVLFKEPPDIGISVVPRLSRVESSRIEVSRSKAMA